MYFVLLPEIILMAASLICIVVGAFISSSDQAFKVVYSIALTVLMSVFLIIIWQYRWFANDVVYLFGNQYIRDDFSTYAKLILIVGTVMVLLIGVSECRRNNMNQFEYPILILLAVLGMLVMVSANHLIPLYIGLELQSLALYIMVAFRRDSIRESEAALKYFILGALASSLLLYGASLVYGFTGELGFQKIAEYLAQNEFNFGAIAGMTFLIAGLAFKLSVVPFHMWTPDVYEGSTTPVTAFFATVPKVASFVLLTKLLIVSFPTVIEQWQPILMLLAMLSMAVGGFAAIAQSNIKRLIAYSAIGHIGYILMGLMVGTQAGITATMFYLPIYIVTTIGLFSCILILRGQNETINDLSGLLKNYPTIAVALLVFLFSMAGIPPLAGFFAKFYVFKAALEQQFYFMVIFAAVMSVVSAFYYLRIIRIMFFENPKNTQAINDNWVLRLTIFSSAVLVAFMLIWPAPLIHLATVAAAALF